MRASIILIGLGLALGAPLIAGPVQAQTNDHLQCYKIRGDLKLKGFVDIDTPQFQRETGCTITRAKLFCAPAQKSNVDVLNRRTGTSITPLPLSALPALGDRICWRVKCPREFSSDQLVTDQFGSQTLTNFQIKFLCTPAVKGTKFCGDNTIDLGEDCDGISNLLCPGRCQADCSCPTSSFPATGQTNCWDSSGFGTGCPNTGHDGEIQAGTLDYMVDNNLGTITDLNTGLMWEKKDDNNGILPLDLLHDKDTVYYWDQAFAVHVAGLNAGSFAGYDDWRLPNIKELLSIVHYETTDPSVDPAFNNDCTAGCRTPTCTCTASSNYWSSTSIVLGPQGAWCVSFLGGDTCGFDKLDFLHVRAVRGGL